MSCPYLSAFCAKTQVLHCRLARRANHHVILLPFWSLVSLFWSRFSVFPRIFKPCLAVFPQGYTLVSIHPATPISITNTIGATMAYTHQGKLNDLFSSKRTSIIFFIIFLSLVNIVCLAVFPQGNCCRGWPRTTDPIR